MLEANLRHNNKKEGRKCFYLTAYSAHNYYLHLYDVERIVKYQLGSERGNPLPPHGLFFPIWGGGGAPRDQRPASRDRLAARVLLHQSWSTGWNKKWINGFTMKDRSVDPSHHSMYYPVCGMVHIK